MGRQRDGPQQRRGLAVGARASVEAHAVRAPVLDDPVGLDDGRAHAVASAQPRRSCVSATSHLDNDLTGDVQVRAGAKDDPGRVVARPAAGLLDVQLRRVGESASRRVDLDWEKVLPRVGVVAALGVLMLALTVRTIPRYDRPVTAGRP